jgi:hypothetical protein
LRDRAWEDDVRGALKHLYETALGMNDELRSQTMYAVARALGSFIDGSTARTGAVMRLFGAVRLQPLLANLEQTRDAVPRVVVGGSTSASTSTTTTPFSVILARALALASANVHERTHPGRHDPVVPLSLSIVPEVSLLQALAAARDPRAAVQVVRCFANLALDGSLSFHTLQHGGWQTAQRVLLQGKEDGGGGIGGGIGGGGFAMDMATRAEAVAQTARLLANVTSRSDAANEVLFSDDSVLRLLSKLLVWTDHRGDEGDSGGNSDGNGNSGGDDNGSRLTGLAELSGVDYGPNPDVRLGADFAPGVRVAAAVALANAAATLSVARHFLGTEVFSSALKLAVQMVAGDDAPSPQLANQLARLGSNMSARPELVAEFGDRFGLDLVATLASISYGDSDKYFAGSQRHQARVDVHRECAATLANLSACDAFVGRMASDSTQKCWPTIYTLAHTSDVETERHLARALANMSANPVSVASVRRREGVHAILHRWVSDPTSDALVFAHAVRAHASLVAQKMRDPKYLDGIYLLAEPNAHGENCLSGTSAVQSSSSSSFSSSSSSSSSSSASSSESGGTREPRFDVVFIHGATGNPFSTWAQLSADGNEYATWGIGGVGAAPDDGDPNQVVWPRDWLPADLGGGIRVLSVGYDTSFTRWVGDAVPLVDQSAEIARKLMLAGVGQRPVLWIAHSMGGLIVKQMLREASRQDHFAPMLEQTRGIVFFSTPHRGAQITAILKQLRLQTVLRTTPAIDDLRAGQQLTDLHAAFAELAQAPSPIPTLAFGENDQTCVGTQSRYTCFQLVSDESANPQLVGPEHRFYKLPEHSHRITCKPHTRASPNYAMVLDFVRDCTREEAPSPTPAASQKKPAAEPTTTGTTGGSSAAEASPAPSSSASSSSDNIAGED